MARRKTFFDKGEPVAAPDTEIADDIVESEENSGAAKKASKPAKKEQLLLKPHTHAGKTYPAGTPVTDLNPNEILLGKLEKLGVI